MVETACYNNWVTISQIAQYIYMGDSPNARQYLLWAFIHAYNKKMPTFNQKLYNILGLFGLFINLIL